MRQRILASVLLLAAMAVGAYEVTLELVAEDYPPFQYLDDNGNAQGFAVTLIEKLCRDARIRIVGKGTEILSWDEAYQRATTEPHTGLYLMVRNAMREKEFRWVGPLLARKLYLMKLASRDEIKVERLADAKAYTIGSVPNTFTTRYLQRSGFKRQVSRPNNRALFQALLDKQVDLVPMLEEERFYFCKQHKLAQTAVVKTQLLDGRYQYYLALHPSVATHTWRNLRRKLKEMREIGDFNRLYAEWFEEQPG